jgi:glycosyltransferase involved in cell wall biosynthesis
MTIAIDIRPAIEEPAGLGKMALCVTQALANSATQHQFILYSDVRAELGISSSRVRWVVLRLGPGPVGRLLWHLGVILHARLVIGVDRFVSFSSLIPAALTRDTVVLVIPDLTSVLFPELHVNKVRWIGRLILKRALRRARHVIAISRNTRGDLLRYAPGSVDEERLSVIPLAYEPVFQMHVAVGDIKRVRRTYKLHSPYVLFVGTIEPRKNVSALISAFSTIADDFPKYELVIAGRRGWKWEETIETAERSHAKGKLRFLHFVPAGDLPALYREATLFVYPSLYEGFGIPPLEAMASGVPVIASNNSSLPEVVGDAGILVDPSEPSDLTEAMSRVLGDSGLRKRMARRGRQRAKLFTWERTARSFLSTLLR